MEDKNYTNASRNFCQQPSQTYMEMLEEAGGDHRVLAGLVAMKDLKETGGWCPTVDARDARVPRSLGKNKK